MRRLLARVVLIAVGLVPPLAVRPAAAAEGERIQAGDSCIYYAIVDDESDKLKYHVYNECDKPVTVTIEVRPATKDEDDEDCDATVVVDLTEVEDAYAELPCPEGSNYVPNVFYESDDE